MVLATFQKSGSNLRIPKSSVFTYIYICENGVCRFKKPQKTTPSRHPKIALVLAGVSEMEFVGLKKPSKIALALAGVSEMELKKHRMPTEKAPKTHQNRPRASRRERNGARKAPKGHFPP